MMYRFLGILGLAVLVFVGASFTDAQSLDKRSDTLRGRILLQVQQHGEAWYVRPDDGTRVFMGRPSDAFAMMRSLGIGITNADLNKISIGVLLPLLLADEETITQKGKASVTKTKECLQFLDSENGDKYTDCAINSLSSFFGTDLSKDSDGDGYPDVTEIVNDYDPFGPGKLPIDKQFTQKLHGKILLQVEKNGEAWYVDPISSKRYALGRPDDALNVMRLLGLGITDADLATIPLSSQRIERATDASRPEKRDREPVPQKTKTTAEQWSGKIARAGDGVLWYVNPADLQRYRIGTKDQAFDSLYFFVDYELSASEDLAVPPLANFNLAADDVDTDGDGLGDTWEDLLATDKKNPDSNGDGMGDLEEMLEQSDFSDENSDWKEWLNRSEGRLLYSPVAALYIPPGDGHSYFFRGPDGAAALVDRFAKPISSADLAAIRHTERDDSVRCGVTEVTGIESLSLDADFSESSVAQTNSGVNILSGKIAADCFEKKFQRCEQAQHIMTSNANFPFASAVIRSRIIGTENGACVVEIENLQTVVFGTPNSELLGKTMACRVTDQSKPIVGRSFVLTAEDGTTTLDPRCTGSYADTLRDMVTQSQGTTIPATVVTEGLYRGPKKQSTVELASSEEFAKFWQSVFSETRPPVIDFASKRAQVFFGERGTTALSFVRAAEFDTGGRALIIRATQGKGCNGAYDAQPYVVIAYSKHEKDEGEDSWLYSPSVQTQIEDGTCPSDRFIISEEERRYTNTAYGFSLFLPDRTSYFTVKETPGVVDADMAMTITFSQYSKIDKEDVIHYAVGVIAKERWPAIEEDGFIERKNAEGTVEHDWVTKLGETKTHVIIRKESRNSAPADLGDYSSDELVFWTPS